MFKIRFLGVSAFEIITEGGMRIFIDPLITKNPLCPIEVEEIDNADLILVTHGAWDHLGDSVELAKRTGAFLLSGHDVRTHAMRSQVPKEQILGTQPGATREIKGVQVRATVAHHISFFESDKDIYLSAPPLGYVITTEEGNRIYHAGDTCLFQDMKLIAELCKPQVMMVPVDSVLPETPAELSPMEAAIATQWIRPDVAIPMHYYPESESPEKYVEFAKNLAPWTKVLLRPEGYFTYEPPCVRFLEGETLEDK